MRKKKLLFIIPILALGIILYLNYKEDKKNEIVIKNKRTYKIDLDSSKVVNHQLSFTDELISNIIVCLLVSWMSLVSLCSIHQ